MIYLICRQYNWVQLQISTHNIQPILRKHCFINERMINTSFLVNNYFYTSNLLGSNKLIVYISIKKTILSHPLHYLKFQLYLNCVQENTLENSSIYGESHDQYLYSSFLAKLHCILDTRSTRILQFHAWRIREVTKYKMAEANMRKHNSSDACHAHHVTDFKLLTNPSLNKHDPLTREHLINKSAT